MPEINGGSGGAGRDRARALILPREHGAWGLLLVPLFTGVAVARQALNTALHLNSEETGTLVLLGQVALAQGDISVADRNFTHACQANARAANAWFLRGYIAWKRGDIRQAAAMLTAARNARGPDCKPSGSVLEGDVQRRIYSESGFLNLFGRQWDGSPDPARAYAQMGAYLRRLR